MPRKGTVAVRSGGNDKAAYDAQLKADKERIAGNMQDQARYQAIGGVASAIGALAQTAGQIKKSLKPKATAGDTLALNYVAPDPNAGQFA